MNERLERIKNNLKERNLKYPTDMELFDDRTYLRDLKTIAQRTIVAAIMAKCAFDLYEAENPDSIKKDCITSLKKFGVENCLFESERIVLNEEYDEALCDTVGWRYEAANALLWATGLLDDIASADLPDDVELEINKVFDFVNSYNGYEDFIGVCKLRTEAELQDAFQLYWHYHWNIIDGMLYGTDPEDIFYDVVLERRRALEWLLYSTQSSDGDWEFEMDT